MLNEKRIGIVGAAGTGKSTLARGLANSLGIDCLLSKTVTQKILERDNYDYGSGIQIEKFLANEFRQRQILEDTIAMHKNSKSFVTDRTLIDLSAYAVVEMHSSSPDVLKEIYDICHNNVGIYTHIVFCEWSPSNLIDNGRRTLNPFYQLLIHSIEKEICTQWDCKPIFIGAMPDSERIDLILKTLEEKDHA